MWSRLIGSDGTQKQKKSKEKREKSSNAIEERSIESRVLKLRFLYAHKRQSSVGGAVLSSQLCRPCVGQRGGGGGGPRISLVARFDTVVHTAMGRKLIVN